VAASFAPKRLQRTTITKKGRSVFGIKTSRAEGVVAAVVGQAIKPSLIARAYQQGLFLLLGL
jgi:hypothetical protein